MASKAGEMLMETAAKKIKSCWGRPDYPSAANLYNRAAISYRASNLWVEAATAYVKLAECRLKSNNKDYHAGLAFVAAANCFKSADDTGKAISCLEKAVRLFEKFHASNRAAIYCKEVGELWEKENKYRSARYYFERAALHFDHDDADSAKNCRAKVESLWQQITV